MKNIDLLSINTIRTLSIDAIEKAQSGHPGAIMGLAPAAYELWIRHLNFNPENPQWANRDRFLLSNGHASMMLYALIYLSNIKEKSGNNTIRISDIKTFRQLNSKCSGHPEYGLAQGVETTTGPLGQGIGNGIGMALAQKFLSKKFNKNNFNLFNYNTYVFCGDGCLMEGISHEAASLAGHLNLDNFCLIYDNNHISIDGKTDLTFSENIKQRFLSYGFYVLTVSNANNIKSISNAFYKFKLIKKPCLIIINSHIGYGSPNKQGKAVCHGIPLGFKESIRTKKFYGWLHKTLFFTPKEVIKNFKNNLKKRGMKKFKQWKNIFKRYKYSYPTLAKQLKIILQNKSINKTKINISIPYNNMSTRIISGKILNSIAKKIPNLIGGSADLSGSNCTFLKFQEAGTFSKKNYSGRNVHFGVREHAAAALANGMALSYLRPYLGTFLTFSDYMKPSIRLSALMNLQIIYIFTHDSIAVGEDGPTHQPIEHLTLLRSIPNLCVFRPANINEVLQSYQIAIKNKGPSAIILTRQNIETTNRSHQSSFKKINKGGYILYKKKTK